MADIPKTVEQLRAHVKALTETIGERSVAVAANLKRAEQYIVSFYRNKGICVHTEPYSYGSLTVANVVAEIVFGLSPRKHFLIGAHYNSVAGTVGADDNASAIAVQLETARRLSLWKKEAFMDLAVTFVSFALEEPPVYGTRYMGSRVYAREAKKQKKKLDGMICLEMVGYSCDTPGCQDYPFPLMFLGYPKRGNFIGIVSNVRSRKFSRSILKAFKKNTSLPAVKLTVPFNGWILPAVRLSDHASFWDCGFKAVMLTDSAFYRNPHYHLPSDTQDTLDYVFMAELVKSLEIFFNNEGK
ncbi:MAG: M28 family peptidase [Deltaproteobacteria bacterium]|nr:M28 family peptidase [Deltaproteobacteria bacterium]